MKFAVIKAERVTEEKEKDKGECGRRGQGSLHNEMALDLSFKNSEETACAKAWKCGTD